MLSGKLLTQLKAKKEIRKRYEEGLKDLPVKFMPVFAKGEPNYWLTVMTINEECKVTPVDIIVALEKGNIESRPVWKPMNMQPVFTNCYFFSHACDEDVGADLFARGICLPSGSAMTQEEQERVIEIIKTVF